MLFNLAENRSVTTVFPQTIHPTKPTSCCRDDENLFRCKFPAILDMNMAKKGKTSRKLSSHPLATTRMDTHKNTSEHETSTMFGDRVG